MPTDIGLERLQELIAAGAQLVEVLPEDDYAPAHLPGAINLPLRELDERAPRSSIAPDRWSSTAGTRSET